jgi:hypothetical protein
VKIHDTNPINVSDHTLISPTLELTLKRIKKCTELIISKPKWKKCDIEVHRNSIKENIMEIDNLEDITTVEIIEKLENVLHNVAKQSIPKYRKNSKIKRTGRKLRNGKIAQASKISKSKFYTRPD